MGFLGFFHTTQAGVQKCPSQRIFALQQHRSQNSKIFLTTSSSNLDQTWRPPLLILIRYDKKGFCGWSNVISVFHTRWHLTSHSAHLNELGTIVIRCPSTFGQKIARMTQQAIMYDQAMNSTSMTKLWIISSWSEFPSMLIKVIQQRLVVTLAQSNIDCLLVLPPASL